MRSPAIGKDLVLAYQGLDGIVRSSRIQFFSRQPDHFKGYTAIWQIDLKPHETIRFGYRIQLLSNSRSISKVGIPMTLIQAKAAESMELQQWQQQVSELPNAELKLQRRLPTQKLASDVDFLRPLLLRLTVWR